MRRFFILPDRILRAEPYVNGELTSLSHDFVGPVTGFELLHVKFIESTVLFDIGGRIFRADRKAFTNATGNEDKLKQATRHKNKMFIKELWQGGRDRARQLGLRDWYVS